MNSSYSFDKELLIIGQGVTNPETDWFRNANSMKRINGGHTFALDSNILIEYYGWHTYQEIVLATQRSFAPEYIILLHTYDFLSKDTIHELSKRAVIIAWINDPAYLLSLLDEHGETFLDDYLYGLDLAYCHFKFLVDDINSRRRHCPVLYIPSAEDHTVFRPSPKAQREDIDVAIVATSPYGNRAEIATALVNAGIALRIYGGDEWKQFEALQEYFYSSIDLEDLVQLYQRTKIVINPLAMGGNTPSIVKARIIQTALTRTFQICDEARELSNYFEIGSELETFSTTAELVCKVEYFLEHERQRAEYAEKAYSRAIREYTFDRCNTDIMKEAAKTPMGIKHCNPEHSNALISVKNHMVDHIKRHSQHWGEILHDLTFEPPFVPAGTHGLLDEILLRIRNYLANIAITLEGKLLGNYDMLLLKGQQLLDRRDYKEATVLFVEAVKHKPQIGIRPFLPVAPLTNRVLDADGRTAILKIDEIWGRVGNRNQISLELTNHGIQPARIADLRFSVGDNHRSWLDQLERAQDVRVTATRQRIAVIYDNTIRKDTTGEYCKKALISLGHDVCHFLPTQLQIIPRHGFDLYLHIDDGLQYGLPADLKPKAWWVIDTHLQYDWDLQKASNFDYVFAAQKDGARKLSIDGIQDVYWLPLAADPDIHTKVDTTKKYDFCFVGNMFPGPRAELVGLLKKHYPNSFVGKAFFEEMAKIYSQSKVVFNQSIRNDINMRFFEAIASGSCLLTNDLSENGQQELLQKGVHFYAYRSARDLLNKMSYLMRNEEKREAVARRGRAEVIGNHTYVHRMNDVIQTILKAQKVSPFCKRMVPVVDNRNKVSIIILTYNALEFTKKCIQSIQEHTEYPYEIIFVDNHSTDGTKRYLRRLVRKHSNYRLIVNGENRGFATGNNQGVQAASGDYVLLLNNDVLVSDGWLASLVSILEMDERIGMVGPITNYISGRQMVKKVPYTDDDEFYTYSRQVREVNQGKISPLRRIAGFAMLLRKDLYISVGGFDETLGLGNYEDDDFCLRVRAKGYAIMMDESTFIHHYGSQSFEANKIDYRRALQQKKSIFKAKWPDVDLEELIDAKNPLSEVHSRFLNQAFRNLGRGRIEEASAGFERVLDDNPISEDALFGFALCRRQQGDNEMALDYLRRLLELNSCYAPAYNQSGIIAAEMGDMERAKTLFSTAIEKDPTFVDAQRNLGEILLALEDYDNGVRTLAMILKNYPDDVRTLLRMAQLHAEVGEAAEARRYAEEVLAHEPGNEHALEFLELVAD